MEYNPTHYDATTTMQKRAGAKKKVFLCSAIVLVYKISVVNTLFFSQQETKTPRRFFHHEGHEAHEWKIFNH